MALLGRGSKACVTGANGFIALHLVEKLLQAGVSVTAAVRSDDPRKLAPLRAMEGEGKLNIITGCNLLSPGTFERAMQDVQVKRSGQCECWQTLRMGRALICHLAGVFSYSITILVRRKNL